MLAPEMKIEIKPLCDKHLVEMEAVRVKTKMGGSDIWNTPAFRCSAPGCTRSFDSGGYTKTGKLTCLLNQFFVKAPAQLKPSFLKQSHLKNSDAFCFKPIQAPQ